MKLVKISAVIVLVALAVGKGGGRVSAAPTSLDSTGTITYDEDTTINPPVNPNNPVEPIDPKVPIVTNPDGGALTVDAVTNLHFGTQKALTTDQSYFAKQVELISVEGNALGMSGNFVQVTDKRLENRTPWTLKAKMTQQFTTANDETLAGATLTYANPFINGANETLASWPTLGATASTFILSESGNSIDVMGTDGGEKGFGTYSIQFGTTAGVDGLTDTTGTPSPSDSNLIENGSVSLFVPGNIKKEKSAYTAKVQWTIEETP